MSTSQTYAIGVVILHMMTKTMKFGSIAQVLSLLSLCNLGHGYMQSPFQPHRRMLLEFLVFTLDERRNVRCPNLPMTPNSRHLRCLQHGFQIDSDQQSLAGDKHDKFFKLLLDIRGNSLRKGINQ